MREFVTANNRIFECTNVETKLDSVTIIFATLNQRAAEGAGAANGGAAEGAGASNEGVVECVSAATKKHPKRIVLESRNADDIEALFRNVTGLAVSFGKYGMPEEDFAEENEKDLILEEPHGIYAKPKFSLAFESITKFEDGSVAVTMHIKSEIERRLDALEESQEIQDGAIMELAQSVGGEA